MDNEYSDGDLIESSVEEQQYVPGPERSTIEQDFYHKPMEKIKKLEKSIKIHLGIAISVVGLCFILWRWLVPASAWWFVYPAFAFAISLTIHKYMSNLKKALIIVVGILNIALFVTNFVIEVNAFPWFIYPLYVTSAIAMAVYYLNDREKYSLLKLFTHEYIMLNLLLFFTWVFAKDYGSYFPWFMYPLIVLAIPLMVVYAKEVYKETRMWVHSAIVTSMLGALVFFTWGFAGGNFFPWFLLFWAPLAGVTGLFYMCGPKDQTFFEVGSNHSDEENPTIKQAGDDDSGNYVIDLNVPDLNSQQ